ncbi:MAG: helicase-related protein [Bacteroidota bacterium]
MPDNKKLGSELFIVDNSDADWKVKNYLHEWADLAHTFDIATGYFEIGALLALDGQWQKLDKLRILMGDEVSKRTKKALLEGVEYVKTVLDSSIEREKESNDFLSGVPSIVDALQNGKMECRVYTKEKFHAKAYITHAKQAVVGSAALVGSSNFTAPGLSKNVELNVQLRREVEILQEWFQRHWDQADDISSEILKVIERHTRDYTPFEVYAKALQEFFKGHEMTASEWELTKSAMYPVLDQYQKEGYQALMKIAHQWGGAFLCDGVGLGKTFIGMMLIERLITYDRKRVMLIVPLAARKPVWENALRRYLPNIRAGFTNLRIFNHTDLLRGGDYADQILSMKEQADVILIDEAHHFRNPGTMGNTRYWKMYELTEGKTVFFLTATPINNRLRDLQHMIELFSRRERPDFFRGAPLGIHSLPGHFRRLENELERQLLGKQDDQKELQFETNQSEAERVLFNDNLFRSLVVQRSRGYVKASQEQYGGSKAIFPKREPPIVADYSVKKTYGRLLGMVEEAFSKKKPLFSLAIYYPLFYSKTKEKSKEYAFEENRQKQLVRLIRIQFLKRFESSARAFEMSCETLLLKFLSWIEKHTKSDAEKRRLNRWKAQNAEIIGYVRKQQVEMFGDEREELDEDVITDEMLEEIEELQESEYRVNEMLDETYLDLDQTVRFLQELEKFQPSHDDKLRKLTSLLKNDPVLKKHKVIIFTEYMATARYLQKELEKAKIDGVDEVDSSIKRDRGDIIRQFAPYYNESSSSALIADGLKESRVLISTDVLSEGLNLQDATRLINYDLHWNPVRLMQRIGRVDRRMNPEIEQRILADHPDQKEIRGTALYWNFLPPDEVDELLKLYSTVSNKTMRISKVFGIEGKKLLKPEDDYEALRDFVHNYEGTPTGTESMHLEYQKLMQQYPDLQTRLNALPGRVYSGKEHPVTGTKAVFFCYALPAPPIAGREEETTNAGVWTEDAGFAHWYLYELSSGRIVEEPTEMIDLIRCSMDTPRHCEMPQKTLTEIRQKIEKHIKNGYFKRVQAPLGVKAVLKSWMELT